MKKILVLPAGMPAAVNYARANRDRYELVGASSNRYESSSGEYSICRDEIDLINPAPIPAIH